MSAAVQLAGVSAGRDIRIEKIHSIGTQYNIYPAAELPVAVNPLLNNLLARHTPFGGREEELGILSAFVSQHSNGYLFVTGPSGFGKTALLANWVRALSQDNQAVCYHFISRLDRLADEESAMLNLCQQLIAFHGLSSAPPARLVQMRTLYLDLLTTPPPQGKRL